MKESNDQCEETGELKEPYLGDSIINECQQQEQENLDEADLEDNISDVQEEEKEEDSDDQNEADSVVPQDEGYPRDALELYAINKDAYKLASRQGKLDMLAEAKIR